jgi:hypothetical protein
MDMRVVDPDASLTYGRARSTRVRPERVFLAKLGHDPRSIYTDVLGAPVPPEIADVIRRLEQREPPGRGWPNPDH